MEPRPIPVDHSDELRPFFNKVCDPVNWKLPINKDVEEKDLAQIVKAIQWFTASHTTVYFNEVTKLFTVTAPGYYATVGA